MAEVVKNSEQTLNSLNRVKTITFNEFYIISGLIIANILVVYYLLGNYVININDYILFNPNFWINGNNEFILQQIYFFIVYSSFLSTLIPLNLYLLVSAYLRYKNNSFTLKQIVSRFLFYNSSLVIIYTLIASNGNSQVFFIGNAPFTAYYNPDSGYISMGNLFGPIVLLSIIVGAIITLFFVLYFSKNLPKKHQSPNSTHDLATWKLFSSNFLIFYCVNLLIIIYHAYYLNRGFDGKYINELFLIEIGVNVSIIFLKLLYDTEINQLSLRSTLKSLTINLGLYFIVFLEYLQIYRFNVDYTISSAEYSNVIGAVYTDYIFIGICIVLYIFRKQIKHYLLILQERSTYYSKIIWPHTKSFFKRINPVSFVLYHLTLRKLNNDDQAVFFAKKFIIIQSKHLKNALPGALPLTIPSVIEGIFANDIERLQQLFKINNIKTYSNKAILKFVMITANLIIKDLQKTLQEHLTQELLKETNDAKQLQVNVEELWQKANKIMVQWESTFTDTELKYKDTLLHKS